MSALAKIKAHDDEIQKYRAVIQGLEEKKQKYLYAAMLEMLGVQDGGWVKVTSRYGKGLGQLYTIHKHKKPQLAKLKSKTATGVYRQEEAIGYDELVKRLYSDTEFYFKLELPTPEEIAAEEARLRQLDPMDEETVVETEHGVVIRQRHASFISYNYYEPLSEKNSSGTVSEIKGKPYVRLGSEFNPAQLQTTRAYEVIFATFPEANEGQRMNGFIMLKTKKAAQ